MSISAFPSVRKLSRVEAGGDNSSSGSICHISMFGFGSKRRKSRRRRRKRGRRRSDDGGGCGGGDGSSYCRC